MAVEKIVIGRDREDLKKFKNAGTAYIGKHIVDKGEQSHLTNPVQMDIARPHVVLVCGKRGTGKSYTAAVIAEEMSLIPKEIRDNLSMLMIDTMGIYWSISMPNERDKELLKDWGLRPKGITDARLYIPKAFLKEYKNVGVKVTGPFTLATGEITAIDWILTFGFSTLDANGIATEKVIKSVQKKFGEKYTIDDIIVQIDAEKRIEESVKNTLINRFEMSKDWGIFEKEGTAIKSLFQKGTVSVIDVSHYMRASAGWSIRTMVVGLICRKIFQERLMARKNEEFEDMTGEASDTIPMAWIIIDEAHQFLPNEGETAASEPLHTLIKEGREPGISVLLITQRPNKLHEDALAQSDLIISHRLTAKGDIDALRSIMQTYVLDDIQELINSLPRTKGSAIVLDDNSERMYMIQVRPRISWHAGGSPSALKDKGIFE